MSRSYNFWSEMTDNNCAKPRQALRQRADRARPAVLREAGDGDGEQPARPLLPPDQRAHVRALRRGPHRRRQVRDKLFHVWNKIAMFIHITQPHNELCSEVL